MKKTTKGSLAAGAAAVLLLGGAGSLAYWTDAGSANAGTIQAGSLRLADGTCDTDWSFAEGSASAGTVADLFVPGDVITKTCDFVIQAVGDNVKAVPSIPDSIDLSASPTNTLSADVTATYDVAGTTIDADSVITEAYDTKILTATIEVTFPFGDKTTVNTNAMQEAVASLNDLTVTLTQVDPNA